MTGTLDDLLQAAPKFHVHEGKPFSWQASVHVLRFIDAHVGPDSRTLEVGAGVSTVLFALKAATHRCIAPFVYEIESIRAFCQQHGISLEKVTFDIGQSDQCLPKLEPAPLDLVLIDGNHGFPVPFLDWHYTAELLKVGGLCIIDDTQIWTGDVLKRFLLQEPEWRLEVDYAPRSTVFRKVQDYRAGKNSNFQPYVVAQTAALARRKRLRLAMGRLVPRSVTTIVKATWSAIRR